MSFKLKAAITSTLFLLVSCMTATPNLHVINGETRMSLTQSAPVSSGADISPDGKYLLTGGLNGFAHWDISKGVLVNRYSAQLPQITGSMLTTGLIPVAFASGGKYALSGGEELQLWDLSTGKLVKRIGGDQAETIGVSRDGGRVLTCLAAEWSFQEDKMLLYDALTGNKITQWDASQSGGIIALSPDGKLAMSTGGGGRKSAEEDRGVINLWNASTGELVHTFAGTGANQDLGEAVLAMTFSADGRHALSGGTDGSVRLWDISSGAELRTIRGHAGEVGTKAVAFSPDGKTILSVGGSDGLAKLWDLRSGSLLKTFRVSDDRFVGIRRFGGIVNGWVSFTPDGKRIVFMGSDASFRIFDSGTGEEIASLVLFGDGEWLVVTSEGYYNSSPRGAQYLRVNFEGLDYTVDQFYDIFYRPDIVAAKLSGREIDGLVSITMKDARKSPPPLVEFTSQPSGTELKKAKVCYRVKSAGGGIGEVRLFHNGKLVQSDGYYREMSKSLMDGRKLTSFSSSAIYADMRSVAVKGRLEATPVSSRPKGSLVEDCRELDVVGGENEVSLSAFNETNTVQSRMKTITFQSIARTEAPRLYILAVGIDKYRDSSADLKYAGKDARDLENRLKIQAATLYDAKDISCHLLTNESATKTGIVRKIDEIARKILPQDGFVFFAAGHGVLLQNQYYLLTHDFNGQVRERDMLSSNEIVESSKKIKALSQLFIFDTCHAGGVDTIIGGLYDARMSVLARKMGLHIYASAGDRQAAMDGYRGNGLFTYTLLDGLNDNRSADSNKDGKITVSGLGGYTKKRTIELSGEIGHVQTPLIINFGKDYPIYRLR